MEKVLASCKQFIELYKSTYPLQLPPFAQRRVLMEAYADLERRSTSRERINGNQEESQQLFQENTKDNAFEILDKLMKKKRETAEKEREKRKTALGSKTEDNAALATLMIRYYDCIITQEGYDFSSYIQQMLQQINPELLDAMVRGIQLQYPFEKERKDSSRGYHTLPQQFKDREEDKKIWYGSGTTIFLKPTCARDYDHNYGTYPAKKSWHNEEIQEIELKQPLQHTTELGIRKRVVYIDGIILILPHNYAEEIRQNFYGEQLMQKDPKVELSSEYIDEKYLSLNALLLKDER